MATEFPIKKGHSKHPLPSPRPAGKHDRKMNLTQIQDLIKFVAKSSVAEVESEQKESKSHMQRLVGNKDVPVHVIAHPLPQPAQPTAPQAPAPQPSVPARQSTAAAAAANEYLAIRSPMTGTFYRAA